MNTQAGRPVPAREPSRLASVEVCALAILPPSVDYTDFEISAASLRL
jgi:hypothetical protein